MSATEKTNANNPISCRCVASGNGTNGRLIVCIDGTSNKFGKENTNVIELYHQLVKNSEQRTYYNSGIGTYTQKSKWKVPKYLVRSVIDGAFARGFKNIVLGAYRWLSENYREGDRIFLFGFSRGAYQVRALAGMLHKVGLIHKGNEEQIPFAYDIYKNQVPQLKGDNVIIAGENGSLDETFKETFCRDVRVHFIGVWDTVSSIGLIRGEDLPGTLSPDSHTCHFRHALALDERRVKFLPEYANGGVMQNESKTLEPGTTAKEVWFPGTHSDIGGGNVDNAKLSRKHPAYLWMACEALLYDVIFVKPQDINPYEWNPDSFREIHESLKGHWRIHEHLFIKHLTYSPSDPSHTGRRRHKGRGRVIQEGQKLHFSFAFWNKNGGDKGKPYKCCASFCKEISDKLGKRKIETSDLVGAGMTNVEWMRSWRDYLEIPEPRSVTDILAGPKLSSEPEHGNYRSYSLALWVLQLTSILHLDNGPTLLKEHQDWDKLRRELTYNHELWRSVPTALFISAVTAFLVVDLLGNEKEDQMAFSQITALIKLFVQGLKSEPTRLDEFKQEFFHNADVNYGRRGIAMVKALDLWVGPSLGEKEGEKLERVWLVLTM